MYDVRFYENVVLKYVVRIGEFGALSGILPFSGKTKEPECLDFKGFQALNEQGMRESNPVGTPHNPHKISISSIEF